MAGYSDDEFYPVLNKCIDACKCVDLFHVFFFLKNKNIQQKLGTDDKKINHFYDVP